jgi:hypothetical protein
MRKALFHIVTIVAACWAVFGFVSILSKLQFAVDAGNWFVAHVPAKQLFLDLRNWLADALSGYHDFMHGVTRVFHLPQLPPFVYDMIGMVSFAVGRGYELSAAVGEKRHEFWLALPHATESDPGDRHPSMSEKDQHLQARSEAFRLTDRRYPLYTLVIKLAHMQVLLPRSWWHVTGDASFFVARILVYGGVVAVILAGLFGVNYIYRQLG